MMRGPMTRLAVVWTRPETVRDDAARALDMIGFAPASADGTAVLTCRDAGARRPGRSTAPWHLAAALSAVKAGGGETPASRYTSHTSVALLLPVATVQPHLGPVNCLRALASMSPGDHADGDPIQALLDAAEETLAADVEPVFLLDATLAPGRPSAEAPLRPRNIMLAGRDPVALDAAVARLIGIDPLSLPVLARGAAAGLGERDLACVDLVGDRDDLMSRPCGRWQPEPGRGLARSLQRTWRAVTNPWRKPANEVSPWHDLWRQNTTDLSPNPEASGHA
jgi:hypothetical protein